MVCLRCVVLCGAEMAKTVVVGRGAAVSSRRRVPGVGLESGVLGRTLELAECGQGTILCSG